MPFDATGMGAAICCPRCQAAFLRDRKNQRYCSQPCQKAATRNAVRGPRKVADSAEARRIHEARKGRIGGLSHALFETPPAYRAAFLQRLIVEGRSNAELRRLVTVRALLRSWVRDEGTGRLHIAHVLNHFCQEVYGLRSFEVLNPDTTLPSVDTLAFPAAYFGPDAPPVYEDGSLEERPCPWSTRQSALHHYKETDHKDHRWEHQGHRDGGFDMHHVSRLPNRRDHTLHPIDLRKLG
jgi:hypothetical protein